MPEGYELCEGSLDRDIGQQWHFLQLSPSQDEWLPLERAYIPDLYGETSYCRCLLSKIKPVEFEQDEQPEADPEIQSELTSISMLEELEAVRDVISAFIRKYTPDD